jgi:polyisoprenoid-binding protein YceI
MQIPGRFRPLVVLTLAVATSMVAANQALIPDKSELVYVTSTMGADVEGSFGRFEAQIDLEPDKLQSSSVTFAVDTSSVSFPAPDVQKELLKSDWLDSGRFPKAEFHSSRITRMNDGRYEITGTLTIKGHAHEIVFPTKLTRSGTTTFASGALTIKRLDYGVGLGEWGDTSLVADAVQIKFKLALSGFGPG